MVGMAKSLPGGPGVSGRLCLHAWRLNFLHPETGVRMSFESQCPFTDA
jgi:23S rRNA-/tRNA-specific pseudouridylate synthase